MTQAGSSLDDEVNNKKLRTKFSDMTTRELLRNARRVDSGGGTKLATGKEEESDIKSQEVQGTRTRTRVWNCSYKRLRTCSKDSRPLELKGDVLIKTEYKVHTATPGHRRW
jgi:hypothetical protein